MLQLGAHPDDEDTGMLVTTSKSWGGRAVYWSATRGEGGQNRRGPEKEEALGVVRTWESLQARELDGGEVLYGPFYDYGFSKHGEDALARWGREDVVREIVRAIRLVQPLVVVSRWNGGSADGHGQHQAIGLVADEAFDLAGDPSAFPELAEHGLAPWEPQKLYHSVAGDWQPGEASHFGEIVDEYEAAGYLRVATGALDPVSGLTFQQQAHLAVNRHRSQGMGFIADPGPYYYYYRLVRTRGEDTGREEGFYDGFDPTLTGLADHPGGGSEHLRERLAVARSAVERAFETFHPARPEPAGLLAAEGAGVLRELRAELDDENLDADTVAALDSYLLTQGARLRAGCRGLPGDPRRVCRRPLAHDPRPPGHRPRTRVERRKPGGRGRPERDRRPRGLGRRVQGRQRAGAWVHGAVRMRLRGPAAQARQRCRCRTGCGDRGRCTATPGPTAARSARRSTRRWCRRWSSCASAATC